MGFLTFPPTGTVFSPHELSYTDCIFSHLLHQRLCALVLYVPLCGGEEGADGVDVDAALDEAGAGLLQLVQAVVVGGVHHA